MAAQEEQLVEDVALLRQFPRIHVAAQEEQLLEDVVEVVIV
jgi:hypothetical protein